MRSAVGFLFSHQHRLLPFSYHRPPSAEKNLFRPELRIVWAEGARRQIKRYLIYIPFLQEQLSKGPWASV